MKPAFVVKDKVQQIWASREAMPQFSPKFMAQVIDVPDDVQVGWKRRGGVWGPPIYRQLPQSKPLPDRIENKLRNDPMWSAVAGMLARRFSLSRDELVAAVRREAEPPRKRRKTA